MLLVLDKLKYSVDILDKSYIETEKAIKENINDILKNTLISGIIQNFEVVYELSWKFIKRNLEYNETASEINALSRKNLYRYAYSKNMIKDIDTWFKFHALRNESSHTYNEAIANDIYKSIPVFLIETKYLLKYLEDNNEW